MDVHQRRGGNENTPAEEQPPVQNGNQQNQTIASQIADVISKCITDTVRNFIVSLFDMNIPGRKKIIIKGLFTMITFFIYLFITKPDLVNFVCQSPINNLKHMLDLWTHLSDTNGTQKAVPADSFIKESITVAEQLVNTDVSMPVKITAMKLSLFELKKIVSFSELTQVEKDEIDKQIKEITNLAQLTVSEMYPMFAMFNSALKELTRYAENLHAHLINKRSIVSRLLSILKPVEVAIMSKEFKDDLQAVEKKLEDVIYNTGQVNSKLANLEQQFGDLEDTAGRLHNINDDKIKKIDNPGSIVKLYRSILGEGDISKDKHQRNLQVLAQFPNFRKEASIQINNVLLRLGKFRIDAESMRETASDLDHVQTLPLDIHVKTLKEAIETLREYQKRYNQKLIGTDRI